MKDYYQILGVSRTATQEQIKEAYRMLAKILHPDRFQGDAKTRKYAEERLKEVNEAYQVLSDPLKRQANDAAGVGDTTRSSDSAIPKPPKPVVSPTVIDFGEIEEGEMAHGEFTIDNQGGEAKELNINYPPDSWFAIGNVTSMSHDGVFPVRVPIWVENYKLTGEGSYLGTITVDIDGQVAQVEVLLRVIPDVEEELFPSYAPDPIAKTHPDFYPLVGRLKPSDLLAAMILVLLLLLILGSQGCRIFLDVLLHPLG